MEEWSQPNNWILKGENYNIVGYQMGKGLRNVPKSLKYSCLLPFCEQPLMFMQINAV